MRHLHKVKVKTNKIVIDYEIDNNGEISESVAQLKAIMGI